MKAILLLGFVVGFASAQGAAQTLTLAKTNTLVSTSEKVALTDGSSLSLREPAISGLSWSQIGDTNSVDYVFSKTKVHLSGPVATTLKSRSGDNFGHRVLRLFSPLSPLPPNTPPNVSGPVNTRAWSTIVGWSPGRSAFPDEHYHEPPQLRLISANFEKQP